MVTERINARMAGEATLVSAAIASALSKEGAEHFNSLIKGLIGEN